ncbi:MAG: (d)CMP kinase [Phycisphaerales bacterium]|nr:(d)CMP kinase [Phycisphaerales bacterium]NNM26185.1 (d)CMP kinase [Phycisphaerales bacterium]
MITIDGPAGTGKSSVAHHLAERLGLEFLDTGAMYRGAALIAIEAGLAPDDGPNLATAIRAAHLHFDWTVDPPELRVGVRSISRRIRDADVSEVVSIVATQPAVRQVMVERQRRIAAEHPRLVTEGRDQGSVVFPDAPVRFYLHADVAVRADRRLSQLAAMGQPGDRAQVMHRIRERDRIDSTRKDGPLIRPEGAIDVDTSDRTLDQVVEHLEAIVRRELPYAGFADP